MVAYRWGMGTWCPASVPVFRSTAATCVDCMSSSLNAPADAVREKQGQAAVWFHSDVCAFVATKVQQ
jgi:hypothetical protein